MTRDDTETDRQLASVRQRLAAKDARYAPLTTDTRTVPVSPPVTRIALPCTFLGPELSAEQRSQAGVGSVRKWHYCEHPDKPLGPVVCRCKGCGPQCPGYPRETPTVLVPQPPAYDGYNRGQRKTFATTAVVTVVVGDEAERMFDVSGPFMERYAKRIGADLVILDWEGVERWPMSCKYMIGRVLDSYDRIVYFDADVIIPEAAVDPAAMCPVSYMGLVDELPQHRLTPQFGLEREYTEFRQSQGFRNLTIPWYCNAGVMVVPRSHKSLLLPPTKPLPIRWCSEQHHTNAMLLDSGLPYCLLDRRCNWQNWTDPGFKQAPPGSILHFSGAQKDRSSRPELMKEHIRSEEIR